MPGRLGFHLWTGTTGLHKCKVELSLVHSEPLVHLMTDEGRKGQMISALIGCKGKLPHEWFYCLSLILKKEKAGRYRRDYKEKFRGNYKLTVKKLKKKVFQQAQSIPMLTSCSPLLRISHSISQEIETNSYK